MSLLENNSLALPTKSPERSEKSLLLLGAYCPQVCAENTWPRPSWRRERNWDRTFSRCVRLVRRTTTQTDPFAPAPLVSAISQLSHTIRLLDSLGYETSGFRSKSWNEFAEAGEPKFDFVFTVAALPHAANKADSDRHLPIS